MTNRLELNWKLDGFVDEQRYYCSETPIDPDNLPVPKAVLAGDLRSHIDADIELGKKYHIAIGSVKKAVEKISEEIRVITNWPYYNANVLSAMNFNGNFNDEKGLSWQNSGVQISTSDYKFGPSSAYFAANSHLRCFDHIFVFNSNAYTIDFFIKINATTVADWPYIFASEHFSKPNGFLCYCDGAGLYDGNGVLKFVGTQGGPALTSTSIIRNSGWKHIEISSDGVTHRLFVDGNLEAVSNTAYNFIRPQAFWGAALNTASTGAESNTTENMFIDSIVVTRGKALHTQNFIPRNRKFEI
ncbi:LamG domain-containing protein [Acinetobacter johnsonii]|uniref:LamG domain-containing protein n=1 Tax=Acinetobacter johnsonii TaxID=40214 RepID=UPI001CC94D7D|nr:LamG domain-containing protein [Acinetobacter johnsonii]UBQ36489.1 LamG domain-containing protein [Acinetobacter johnsonii]